MISPLSLLVSSWFDKLTNHQIKHQQRHKTQKIVAKLISLFIFALKLFSFKNLMQHIITIRHIDGLPFAETLTLSFASGVIWYLFFRIGFSAEGVVMNILMLMYSTSLITTIYVVNNVFGSTTISDKGIKHRSLFSAQTLTWAEIKSVDVRIMGKYRNQILPQREYFDEIEPDYKKEIIMSALEKQLSHPFYIKWRKLIVFPFDEYVLKEILEQTTLS